MADSSLFSSIDVNKTGLPTQLTFTQPALQTGVDEYGNTVTWRRPSEVATSGVQPVYYTDVNGNQSVDYYQAATPTLVNGVPAYAQYDASGKLTGYQGAANVRDTNSLGESVIGYWDASGKAKPVAVSSGGGLFDNLTNVVSGVGNYITENPLQAAALAAAAYGLSGGFGGEASSPWYDAGTSDLATSYGGPAAAAAGAAEAAGAIGAGEAAAGAAGAGGLTGALSSLTPAQTAALAKAGITAAGLLGGGAAATGLLSNIGGGNAGTVSLPVQDRSGISSGSAQYTPEYYAAIQSKYNQMMPQQPRDVTTELKNWYETKYAPSVTVTPKAV